MSKNYGLVLFAALVVSGLSQLCLGAETSVNTNETESKSLMDRLYLNYFATYHGATLGDAASPYAVDRTGKPSSFAGINLDSEVTGAYMFDSNVGVGPVVPFIFAPVLGQGITLGDVGVKAFDKQAFSSGGLNVYANLILQAPTSKGSQARNMTFAVKTTPNARYNFSGSRWAVGAWTEAKAYLGVTADKTFKLYGAPYVNYQLAPKFSLNLLYEMEAHHNVGDTQALSFTNYQTDLQPGFIWSITPHVMVNPFVQLFTGNTVSLDRTAVGAVLSATLL